MGQCGACMQGNSNSFLQSSMLGQHTLANVGPHRANMRKANAGECTLMDGSNHWQVRTSKENL